MYLLNAEHVDTVTKAAETAIRRGNDLLKWWNQASPTLSPIEVDEEYQDVTMQGFFAPIPVEGVVKEGMGCLQTSTFRRGVGAPYQEPVDLHQWTMEHAIHECYRPDGTGFRYRPLLAREVGKSEVTQFPEGPPVRLAEVNSRYEWIVQRLDLPDYALAFPLPRFITKRLRKLLTESGSVVFYRGFGESSRPPIEGAVDQVTFGYAVVPWQVDRTILGFGPGRFYSALKQYRIFLIEDHSVVIEVVFIVCPRSEKILDLGGFDPVYGSARLLEALTFGRTGIVRWAHDAIDNYALGHHGRVHIHMLEGMRGIWEGTNWIPADQGALRRQPTLSSARAARQKL